jgi:hypothetical protein
MLPEGNGAQLVQCLPREHKALSVIYINNKKLIKKIKITVFSATYVFGDY